jgi:hypothetical protein
VQPAFVTELDTLIRARYPLLYLVSWEEQRLEQILSELARAHGKTLYQWTAIDGLRKAGNATGEVSEGTDEPNKALQAIAEIREPALVLLKDFHPYLTDALAIRRLRQLGQTLRSTYTTVLLLSPVLSIPPELEKDLNVVDIPLPRYRELFDLLKEIVAVVRRAGTATVDLNRVTADQLVRASLGLTLSEAENAFAKAIAHDGKLDGDDVQRVQEEKRQIVRKSGILEYYEAQEGLDSVGGLDLLKGWLKRRRDAFTERALQFGLPCPKGMLLLGVQGCGKSLTARAVAHAWRLPMLRLDLGRIFSGLVGSSEENLRRAIGTAESVAPVVLWVDELEKGLAGSTSNGANDTGVSARVFGALLTWLQEKKAPVFVVATANKIDLLPPELLRKGRFDEIFFVDLPVAAERDAILQIHLRARKRDPGSFDTRSIAKATEGFSGAELEQLVVAGLFEAFHQGVELAQPHLENALAETVPLSRLMREEMQALRSWARERTRPASSSAPS